MGDVLQRVGALAGDDLVAAGAVVTLLALEQAGALGDGEAYRTMSREIEEEVDAIAIRLPR